MSKANESELAGVNGKATARKGRAESVHEHHFITVGSRRWCLGCDLFQTLKAERWVPLGSFKCGRYTPWARKQDGLV